MYGDARFVKVWPMVSTVLAKGCVYAYENEREWERVTMVSLWWLMKRVKIQNTELRETAVGDGENGEAKKKTKAMCQAGLNFGRVDLQGR